MKKVVVHAAGGYDKLVVEQCADPAPGPGEVLVAVEAIGVNYADCVVRMGLYASAKKYVGWPITPGFELAGTVAAVGAGVTRWEPGQRVLGIVRFGAYATRVVVPEGQLFALPERFSMAEGASFPAVFMTAWYALCELAHPRRGGVMLVHSGAGGVGGALVQVGKVLGLRSVAVVGAAHKVALARSLGADAVIDKSSEALWPAAKRHAPGGYDLVLDANGVSTLGQSYAHLRTPGKLVVYGFASMLPRQGGRPAYLKLAYDYARTPRFNPLEMTNENKSVLAFNVSYLFDEHALLAEGMNALLGWVAQGKLTPLPVREFALDDVADAHRALESGSTVGKLVLRP